MGKKAKISQYRSGTVRISENVIKHAQIKIIPSCLIFGDSSTYGWAHGWGHVKSQKIE